MREVHFSLYSASTHIIHTNSFHTQNSYKQLSQTAFTNSFHKQHSYTKLVYTRSLHTWHLHKQHSFTPDPHTVFICISTCTQHPYEAFTHSTHTYSFHTSQASSINRFYPSSIQPSCLSTSIPHPLSPHVVVASSLLKVPQPVGAPPAQTPRADPQPSSPTSAAT